MFFWTGFDTDFIDFLFFGEPAWLCTEFCPLFFFGTIQIPTHLDGQVAACSQTLCHKTTTVAGKEKHATGDPGTPFSDERVPAIRGSERQVRREHGQGPKDSGCLPGFPF